MTNWTIDDLDEIIDTRDIIERIEALQTRDVPDSDDPLDEFELQELLDLRAFEDEYAGYIPDWQYGETLIRDDYFVTYAQELAEDIGAIDKDAGWPTAYIDWDAAADALRQDYTEVELRGTSYWTR